MAAPNFSAQDYGSGLGDITGFGLGVFGTLGAAGASRQVAGAEQDIARGQMAIEQQKSTYSRLSTERAMRQNVRNAQMARSLSLSTASGQGAQFSSGLAGAYGSIGGQFATNQLASSENEQITQSIFSINQQIDSAKIAESQAKSRESEFGAIAGLGKGLGTIGGDLFKFAPLLLAA